MPDDRYLPPMPENSRTGAPGRVVAVAGATGLVGQHLLERLLADPDVSRVHVFGRRAPGREHPHLTIHLVDFASLPPLPPLDEAYLALGTTIRSAGSRPAFRAVDLDANLAFARAAVAAGARRLGLVSAMGADSDSPVFYNRVKGELEDALDALDLEALVVARPSLLLGDRSRLGQPRRPLERLAQILSPLFVFLPPDWRPVRAEEVAACLALRVPAAHGHELLRSGAVRAAARAPAEAA